MSRGRSIGVAGAMVAATSRPEAASSGTVPAMNAIDVITIGRKANDLLRRKGFKVDDRWQIVNKIFTRETRREHVTGS